MEDSTQTGNNSEDDSRLHIVATAMEVFCITIISLLTLLLNAMNFILLSQLPTFKNNMGMYLRSLSCAGFITGLIFTLSIYPAVFGYSYFPYHQLICEIQAFIIVQASDVSIVTQAMLNLDRYISIYYHMKYMQFMSIRKCQIINLAIWIISFMFGVPVFISLGATYMKNSYLCSPDLKSNRIYTMSLITLILLPATTIMFFSYIQLLKISHRHATQIEAQISAVSSNKSCNKESGKRSGGKNMKALKMLLVITFAFNMTWLPFTGLSMYRMFSGGETEPHWIGFFIPWWAQVGTLINAVIYFVFSKEYRLGLMKYLKLKTKTDEEKMIARTSAWM